MPVLANGQQEADGGTQGPGLEPILRDMAAAYEAKVADGRAKQLDSCGAGPAPQRARRQTPFPQAFIFVAGQGRVKIGDHTREVRSWEAYYVPPGSDHIVRTEDPAGIELV